MDAEEEKRLEEELGASYLRFLRSRKETGMCGINKSREKRFAQNSK